MVSEPVTQYLKSFNDVELRLVVCYAVVWPDALLEITLPWRVVHDIMQPNVDGVWVQHGVNPVEHIEHQFALLPDRTSVGIHSASVIPVLQEMHEVCPLPLSLDSDICLVISAVDGGPWKL